MEKPYNIWIFAGESSGDIYGAELACELRKKLPAEKLRIAGMGGEKMRGAGVEIMVDSTELGVVGCVEIMKHIFVFIRIFLSLVKRAEKERPDAVVLIDYPGFNIRFAKQMFKRNIPVIWYISPQVWAWRKSNIPKLAAWCRKMMVIFPFEPQVYKGTGLDIEFVGHPLVDIVKSRNEESLKRDPSLVALLPGSRTHEVTRLLQPMLETARLLYNERRELRFVISAPREKISKLCEGILEKFKAEHVADALPEIKIFCGATPRILKEAGTGIAASGTVTVECAIAGLPLVVVYKLNSLTFKLARIFITLFRGFFTMVNIIANKTVFEEFVQFQVTTENLLPAIKKILPGGERRNYVEEEMEDVTKALSSGSEIASSNAAKVCIDLMEKGRTGKK
ncbi:MAG: lipid-A-disaccharide synthase [Lentisphaerae bacterium GWF2_45_14]|nr:MAG: lipid-A-disaccharide synthase [Lentisphaerae bacterium GWF2_45_14]